MILPSGSLCPELLVPCWSSKGEVALSVASGVLYGREADTLMQDDSRCIEPPSAFNREVFSSTSVRFSSDGPSTVESEIHPY